jgi:hypothetical protein
MKLNSSFTTLTTQQGAPRLDTDLLTERQAREQELPMSLAWYRRARLVGGGAPFIRIGNRVFYRRGELRRWIQEQQEKWPTGSGNERAVQ